MSFWFWLSTLGTVLLFQKVRSHPSSRSRFITYLLRYDAEVRDIKKTQYYLMAAMGAKFKGDLDCDFDNPCCWRNSFSTESALSFQEVTGLSSKSSTNHYFGTRKTPDGTFAMVGVAASENPKFEAMLISCPLVCTNEQVAVSFHYWKTPSVQLFVCVRDSFYDNYPSDPVACKLVEGNNPGPTTQLMPPGEVFDIVIAARNFVNEGDIVIIDNIRVDFVPCPKKPVVVTDITPQPTTSTASPCQPVCRLVPCDFESNSICGNAKQVPIKEKESGVSKASPNLQVATGRFGTARVTGIPKPGEGNFYIAVELKQEEKSALEVDVGDLSQAVVVRVLRYTATDGIQMIGCCDSLDNCPLETNPSVNAFDRTWKHSGFLCPKGTKKIIFGCMNSGHNIGSCGIDDIKLFYPNPAEPENVKEVVEEFVCEC